MVGQHLTRRRLPSRIRPMNADASSLATLLNEHLDRLELTIADAARMAGLSYRQMHRLCNQQSQHIQPATITKLERLGLDRRAMALAAYESNGTETSGESRTEATPA